MLRTITFTEVIDMGVASAAQNARVTAIDTTTINNGFSSFNGILGLALVGKSVTNTGPNQITVTITYSYDFAFDPSQRWPDDTALGYATAGLFGPIYRTLVPSHVIEVEAIT